MTYFREVGPHLLRTVELAPHGLMGCGVTCSAMRESLKTCTARKYLTALGETRFAEQLYKLFYVFILYKKIVDAVRESTPVHVYVRARIGNQKPSKTCLLAYLLRNVAGTSAHPVTDPRHSKLNSRHLEVIPQGITQHVAVHRDPVGDLLRTDEMLAACLQAREPIGCNYSHIRRFRAPRSPVPCTFEAPHQTRHEAAHG